MERFLTTFIALLLLSCAAQTGWAQSLVLEQRYHDFGTLTRADDRFADFQIRNDGDKEALIFRVEGPRSLDVKMSSKTIAPGATETVRLQYNPEAAGPFEVEAKVFASPWMEPRVVKLTGMTTFAQSAMPCPDFNATPAGSTRPFHVSIRGADMQPVDQVRVRLYREGRLMDEWRSNEYGEATGELLPGRYFLVADWKGSSADTAVYTSTSRDHVLLVLPEVVPEVEEELALETRIPRPSTPPAPVVEEIIKETPAPVQPAPAEPEENLTGDSDLLPLSKYKQSNVVFLVDVSTSMKHEGRLDLLKIAMTDLLDALRDADRFTLISYASDTKTLVEARTELDREACADAIMALQASGSTEGAKAIDKAGRAAQKHFLPDGNNQIILATDGAFNEGAGKAKKLVNKYRRKDIQTSVLCIRCGKFTTKEMTELTEVGQGQFVPITSADEAGERLLREVQRSALR